MTVSLLLALALYVLVSVSVPLPRPTPLDFRSIAGLPFVLLQLAMATILLVLAGRAVQIAPADFALGYAAGTAWTLAPYLLSPRRCTHQFEVRNLYPFSEVAGRELLVLAVAVPAIALCEETLLRGAGLPAWVPFAAQAALCLPRGRRDPIGVVLACGVLAALHATTGSVSVAAGAHAAILTFAGRLRSPGVFGAVYPLFEQARLRDLSPAWRAKAVEIAAGILLVWGLR